MTALLDSHVVLWWLGEPDRLSAAVRSRLESSRDVLISPVTCWEIGTLHRRGRIRLDRPLPDWIAALVGLADVEVLPLTPEAAAWAGGNDDAGFPTDPADRLLYATAREHRVPFVTKDDVIRRYADMAGDVRVIW